MTEDPMPVDRMTDLSPETRRFLARLDEEDLETLDHGLNLVRAMMTVGKFAKWLIVGILGLFVGMVMFLESLQKLLQWFKAPG